MNKEINQRTLVAMPKSFCDGFVVWRKEMGMTWDAFGLYLVHRSDFFLEKDKGIVTKFKAIARDKKGRKNVAFSKEVFDELTLAKKRRKCNWNEFFRQSLANRKRDDGFGEYKKNSSSSSTDQMDRITDQPQDQLENIDLRESSSRYAGFKNSGFGAVVFYIRPEVIELIKDETRGLDRKIELFLLRDYGANASIQPSSIESLDEDPRAKNLPLIYGGLPRKTLLNTLPDIDALKTSTTSTKKPPSDDQPPPHSIPSFPEEEIKINGKLLKFQIAPERNIDPKSLSTSQRRWLKFRKKWIEKAKRWRYENSDTLAWPEGAKVRVIGKEEEIHEKDWLWKVEAYFVYELTQWDSFFFLKPYRLNFFLSEVVAPGAPERVDKRKFKAFEFSTYEEMQNFLLKKEDVFMKLDKERKGERCE